MTIDDIKFFMILLVVFSNLILNKQNSEKLKRYRHLQITMIVLSFLYIVGVNMLSIYANSNLTDSSHVLYLLLIVLIIPLIDTMLSSVINYDIYKIKSVLLKIYNIIFAISIPSLIIFHFVFRNTKADEYSLYVFMYIMIVFFIVNDREPFDTTEEDSGLTEDN